MLHLTPIIILYEYLYSCQDLAIFVLIYTLYTSMFNVALMWLVCMITLHMHAELVT